MFKQLIINNPIVFEALFSIVETKKSPFNTWTFIFPSLNGVVLKKNICHIIRTTADLNPISIICENRLILYTLKKVCANKTTRQSSFVLQIHSIKNIK